MSIIQEALKRAQYNYAGGKKSLPQEREGQRQEPVVPAPVEAPDVWTITKKIGVIVYIVVLLALVTGFGIRALFSKITAMDKERRLRESIVTTRRVATDNAAAPSLPVVSVERAAERPPALVSSGQANQSPDLVLNGIMYIEEKPKAIINGTVVREGDVISGATVTSITQNNVLLKYNNNDNKVEVSLKLKE